MRYKKKVAHIKHYRKNCKTNVILDVRTVRNAVHELHSSSLDLQGHNLNLNRANKKLNLRKWTDSNAFGFTAFTLVVHMAKKLVLRKHFYVNS